MMWSTLYCKGRGSWSLWRYAMGVDILSPVVVSCGLVVVGMGWGLNFTSAICTHSAVDGFLMTMKLLKRLASNCMGMETLVRDVQSCMSLVRSSVFIGINRNSTGSGKGKIGPV